MSGSLAFGQKIRELRMKKRMTLRALATTLGLSAPFLSDVEHGRRMPEHLDAFALHLAVDVEELRALDPRVPKTVATSHEERIRSLEQRVEALEDRLDAARSALHAAQRFVPIGGRQW